MKGMAENVVVLRLADEVLEKRKTMDNLILQLPLGKIIDVRLISIFREKSLSNGWSNTSDLMKSPLVT
ncbi:MAG: hypothetical protein EZS28_005978 [Streblomastix strix]|uniref:Uncharacterized protein n=1 Tax=Streblomastix strix TaxID=222440 RepID=A0A5J4WU44_9EUKA|nr:MAG: hypothetical protein EZS28_005978 [Streblomastix strix]